MSWEYSCPSCKAMLNPGKSIILEMKRGDVDCLIGLHPQPGKYEIYLPPNVFCEEGSEWDFACPMCKASLVREDDPRLCELELLVDGEALSILFSRVAGEHATFIMHHDTLRQQFGSDVGHYSKKGRKAKAERS